MASILNGKFQRDDMTSKAMGGTELLAHRLVDNVDSNLLQDFEIQISRTTSKDSSKRQLLWVHDLAEDPAVAHLNTKEGYDEYEKIIFVSHWQQEMYAIYLGVPYSKGVVIPNAIQPIEEHTKPDDGTIRLIYTSTPHRGLQLLYPVFDHLSKKYDNIELDVYSSFALYGWDQRDEPFQELFKALEAHPKIRHHGAVSNDEVREALKKADIFAYPSIWKETSCLCLIEALSAGLDCVHSSLAALPETSKGLTRMYEYTESPNDHVQRFAMNLDLAIQDQIHNREVVRSGMEYAKPIVDDVHDLQVFKHKWEDLLKGLLTSES